MADPDPFDQAIIDIEKIVAEATNAPYKEPTFADIASKETTTLSLMHSRAVPLSSHMQALAEAPPQRMLLWDSEHGAPVLSEPGTYIGVQYNPTEIDAGVDVDWNRFKSPGGHYAHMHFAATNNYTLEFELYFSAFVREDLIRITAARNLLHRWCQPVYDDGWSQGPPRLWLEWAGSFRFQCYLVDCKFKHLKFALNGETTRFSAKVKFEEAADTYQFTGNESQMLSTAVRGLHGYQAPTSTAKRALRSSGPGSKVSKSVRGNAATKNKDRRK